MASTSIKARKWHETLLAGRLSEAKAYYLESDDETVLGSHFWLDLESLQRHLRAKHWQRAYNVVEDFVDESGTDMIDTAALLAEIEVLKETSALLDRRRPEEALEALEKVTQPLLLAEKLCQQGTANIFLNNIEQAKQEFVSGLELDPDHYRSLTNIGNLYLENSETGKNGEAGEIDKAIHYYEQALSINEDFPNALHNLGVAYRQKGQIAKSVGYIKKAQANTRKNESADARGKLSSSVARQGAKYLQYGFYALAIILALLFLRSRGIL